MTSTRGNLEIRTLKPNRFKNQSSDTQKLLDQNGNHQEGFIKQKTVALHHCGFKLNTVIVITIIDEIVVTGDQNNIESDDYMSTVALL